MVDYPYEAILVADPLTFKRAVSASCTVYDVNDTAQATPLALKDMSGLPLPNPVTSTADAFIPPLITTSEGIKIVGGGLTVVVYSHQGLKNEAVAAREAAETAAATAGAEAVADVEARIAAGDFKGDKGLDGANVLPTDDAIEQAVKTPGTKTATALSTLYATKDEAIAPPSRRIAPPRLAMISTFKAGHGWTKPFGVGTLSDSTADPALGTQFVRVVTDAGTAGTTPVRRLALPARNLTGKQFAILMRVDQPTLMGNATLYVGKDTINTNEQLRFASNLTGLTPNAWEWVYFSFAELVGTAGVPDRTAVVDYMLLLGGRGLGAVTIDIQAVAIMDKNPAYPNGVVSFGFDDGYASSLTLAAPKLDEYGFPADLYLILDRIGMAGQLTVSDIQKLVKYHRWGVGAHSATVANHNLGFPAMTLADVEADLRESRRWLMANGFGAPDYLALPLSQTNAAVQQLITKYYSTARGQSATRRGVLPPENPMFRNAVIVSDGVTTIAALKDHVDKAYANGLWLEFIIHEVTSGVATGNQTSMTIINELVDYIATKGIPVDTVHQVMRAIS